MKLFVAALSLVAGSTIVYARPLHRVPRADDSCSKRGSGNVAGAAFFLTNQPDGNFIVGSDIGNDGKLTFNDAIWAGGLGSHGQVASLGPDALFSQGSVKVAGKNVFAVNAGSNTLAMFSMDENQPANLKMVGQPVNSGGEFPVSVAISKKSGQVCALNGGKVNGVNCFKQDPKLGLVPMANTQRSLNLNQTTPPTGPAGSVSHVVFSEDDTKLIASVKGVPPTPGFLATWDLDANTGALSNDFTKAAPTEGGLLPFSMSIIPGKNAVLATDPGVGFDIFDFQNGNNASSSAVAIQGQKATCWSTLSPKVGNFFLTDVGTGVVTEAHVDDQLKGSVVKQYPQGNGSATIDNDIATIRNKDFLYVMAPGVKSIMVLSLNGPGRAQPLQTFNFEDATKNAGVTVDSNNLQGMTVFVNGN